MSKLSIFGKLLLRKIISKKETIMSTKQQRQQQQQLVLKKPEELILIQTQELILNPEFVEIIKSIEFNQIKPETISKILDYLKSRINFSDIGKEAIVRSIGLTMLSMVIRAMIEQTVTIICEQASPKNIAIKDPLRVENIAVHEKPMMELINEIKVPSGEEKELPEWWPKPGLPGLYKRYKSPEMRRLEERRKISFYFLLLSLIYCYLNGEISLKELKAMLGNSYKSFLRMIKNLIKVLKNLKKKFLNLKKKLKNLLKNGQLVRNFHYIYLFLRQLQIFQKFIPDQLKQLVIGIIFSEVKKRENFNQDSAKEIFLKLHMTLALLRVSDNDLLKIWCFLEKDGLDFLINIKNVLKFKETLK